MTEHAFTPIIFVKVGCPFCFKLRLFLLEAGLLDRVRLIEGQSPEEHQVLANRLKQETGTSSFPTAEVAPGKFLTDSDALVAHFASLAEVAPESLPTYHAYVGEGGILQKFQQLYRHWMSVNKGSPQS